MESQPSAERFDINDIADKENHDVMPTEDKIPASESDVVNKNCEPKDTIENTEVSINSKNNELKMNEEGEKCSEEQATHASDDISPSESSSTPNEDNHECNGVSSDSLNKGASNSEDSTHVSETEIGKSGTVASSSNAGAPPSDEGAYSSTAAANSSNAGACASSNMPIQSLYHVKWIKFKGEQVAIITQNENGPCPLLAIMNILLLQGKVKLPNMIEIVSSDQLMEYLGDCIFEHAPKNITEESRLNYEQNMSDAMAVFHKLQTGLDVNVKFTGVSDFEYTPECIVFDLLNIQLYHGWLVDPQNPQEAPAVGNCSYNQLVEKVITQKNSSEESQVTEALVVEEFLDRSSHQLTYHGLCSLSSHLKDSQLAVFFRNNHFSTVLKHRDELLVLVTDQGFLTESNVVWETLSNVEGDCHFVDAEFRTYRKPEASTTPVPTTELVNTPEQVDQDYLVALSLQQETQEESPPSVLSETQGLTDHELALRLQEEEDRQMATMQQQQQGQQRRQQQAQRNQQVLSEQYQQQQQEHQERNKKSDCTIL